MGKIWVTSDLHFGHDKAFCYGPRGFDSVEEMNEAIVRNWNELVEDEDDVYVLGDLMLGDTEKGLELLETLKGRLHIVKGNHDTDARILQYSECPNVVEIQDIIHLKVYKVHIYMSHYPTLVGNYDDGRSLRQSLLNLCGHSHTTDPFADWDKGRIYHCELDAHDMKPILIEEILESCREELKREG